MRLVLAAATSLALAMPAAAQSLDVPSGTYANDKTHTSILWKVNHFGQSTYTGMFARGGIEATVELDADDVANSSVTVTLSGDEVRTLHPIADDPRGVDFDAEIESDMFLGTDAAPQITFTSTSVEVTGDNTADITGDLTIGDQTHPLTLSTTLNKAADHPMAGVPVLGITATGTLQRSQWGVDGLLGPIGDEVTLEIQAEFLPAQ